eukprot:gene2142-3792_t
MPVRSPSFVASSHHTDELGRRDDEEKGRERKVRLSWSLLMRTGRVAKYVALMGGVGSCWFG